MPIDTITPNEQDYPSLGQLEAEFESNTSHLLSTHLPRFETEFNTSTGQITDTIANINTIENNTINAQIEAENAKDEAVSAKDTAVGKANEIQGYVIPTEATYSADDIDSKIYDSSSFAQHGLVPNDGINEIRPQDMFEEVDVADVLRLSDTSKSYQVRFTDGIYPISQDDFILPKAPFATGSTDELLDDSINGLATQSNHSKGDIVVTGNELVENGTFDTDVSGWTAQNAAGLTQIDGQININANTSDHPTAYQDIGGFANGKSYILEFTGTNVGMSGLKFYVGSTSDDYSVFASDVLPTGSYQFSFNSNTTGTLRFSIRGFGTQDDGNVRFDNISVKLKDQSYIATEDTTAGELLSGSKFKAIPYVTKQVALLIEKTSAGTILNTVKPLVNMYGEESVETYEADIFSELGYSQSSDRVYTDGSSEFVLVGLKGFLNSGAYHPWFNEFGCNPIKSLSLDWHTDWYTENYVDSTFIALTKREFGDNNKGYYDLASIAGGTSRRPDSKFYDKTYIEGQNGLICYSIPNANKPTYKHMEEVKRNLVDGYIENGTFIEQVTQSTTGTVSTLEVSDGTLYSVGNYVQIYDITNSTLHGRELILSIDTNTLTLENTIVKVAGDYIISGGKSTNLSTQGNVTTTAEVLADPPYYTDDMKSLLASGDSMGLMANLVDDNGNSNIPNGTKTVFKLNMPTNTNYSILVSVGGADWVDGATAYTTAVFDAVANTVTFGTAPAVDDLIIVSSATHNQSVIKTDILQDVQAIDNFAIATASSDINNYNGLMNTVSGVVQTGTDTNTFSSITKVDNDVFSFTDDTTVRPTAIPFVADGYVGVFGSDDNVIDKSNQYIKASSVRV